MEFSEIHMKIKCLSRRRLYDAIIRHNGKRLLENEDSGSIAEVYDQLRKRCVKEMFNPSPVAWEAKVLLEAVSDPDTPSRGLLDLIEWINNAPDDLFTVLVDILEKASDALRDNRFTEAEQRLQSMEASIPHLRGHCDHQSMRDKVDHILFNKQRTSQTSLPTPCASKRRP
jgi:hypothetical protein